MTNMEAMNCSGRFSELLACFGRTYENCLGLRLGCKSVGGILDVRAPRVLLQLSRLSVGADSKLSHRAD